MIVARCPPGRGGQERATAAPGHGGWLSLQIYQMLTLLFLPGLRLISHNFQNQLASDDLLEAASNSLFGQKVVQVALDSFACLGRPEGVSAVGRGGAR